MMKMSGNVIDRLNSPFPWKTQNLQIHETALIAEYVETLIYYILLYMSKCFQKLPVLQLHTFIGYHWASWRTKLLLSLEVRSLLKPYL